MRSLIILLWSSVALAAPLSPIPCPPGGPHAPVMPIEFPPGLVGSYESVLSQARLGPQARTSPRPDGAGIPGARHRIDVVMPGAVWDAQLGFGNMPLQPGAAFRIVRPGKTTYTYTPASVVTPSPSASSSIPVGWRVLTNATPRFTLEYDAQATTPVGPSTDFDFVSTAIYSCRAAPVDTIYELPRDRNTLGVLLGAGDVLKFVTAPEARVRDWVVWVDTSFNTRASLDVDLYAVRSDQAGTLDTAAPIRALSINTDGEFFVVRGLAAGATITLAARARSGSGSFIVRATPIERTIPLLRAGFSFATSTADVDEAERALRFAQRQWFSMSGGRLLFERVELSARLSNSAIDTCECQMGPCDVCFHNQAGRSWAPLLSWVDVFRNSSGTWSPRTVTHELGHYPLGALDEYGDHTEPWFFLCHSDLGCGHSLMGSFEFQICNSRNHALPGATWPAGHVGTGARSNANCASMNATAPNANASLWSFYRLGAEPTADVDVRVYPRAVDFLSFLSLARMPAVP